VVIIPALCSQGEVLIRTRGRLMLSMGMFARGLRLLPGCSVDLFKPTALAKRLVVNSIVLMNRQQRPPPPPEAFPEPFAKSRPANRTPNAAGADYTYLQAGPPPGNIHAPRGEFSHITLCGALVDPKL
jgi:hypothetical protein